jgi:hypothetical protein
VAVFQPPTTNPIEEPTIMRVTCYTGNEGAICSTGIKPHYGVVAGAKEWEGKAVLLYTFDYNEGGEPVPKECVGLFTILDTGAGIDTDNDGKGDTIKNGQSLDVYVDTKEQAQEWTREYGDYLLAIIVEGEG